MSRSLLFKSGVPIGMAAAIHGLVPAGLAALAQKGRHGLFVEPQLGAIEPLLNTTRQSRLTSRLACRWKAIFEVQKPATKATLLGSNGRKHDIPDTIEKMRERIATGGPRRPSGGV